MGTEMYIIKTPNFEEYFEEYIFIQRNLFIFSAQICNFHSNMTS